MRISSGVLPALSVASSHPMWTLPASDDVKKRACMHAEHLFMWSCASCILDSVFDSASLLKGMCCSLKDGDTWMGFKVFCAFRPQQVPVYRSPAARGQAGHTVRHRPGVRRGVGRTHCRQGHAAIWPSSWTPTGEPLWCLGSWSWWRAPQRTPWGAPRRLPWDIRRWPTCTKQASRCAPFLPSPLCLRSSLQMLISFCVPHWSICWLVQEKSL